MKPLIDIVSKDNRYIRFVVSRPIPNTNNARTKRHFTAFAINRKNPNRDSHVLNDSQQRGLGSTLFLLSRD